MEHFSAAADAIHNNRGASPSAKTLGDLVHVSFAFIVLIGFISQIGSKFPLKIETHQVSEA